MFRGDTYSALLPQPTPAVLFVDFGPDVTWTRACPRLHPRWDGEGLGDGHLAGALLSLSAATAAGPGPRPPAPSALNPGPPGLEPRPPPQAVPPSGSRAAAPAWVRPGLPSLSGLGHLGAPLPAVSAFINVKCKVSVLAGSHSDASLTQRRIRDRGGRTGVTPRRAQHAFPRDLT